MAIRTLRDTGSTNTVPVNIDGAVYSLITSDCVIGGIGDEFKITYTGTSLSVSFTKGSHALIGGNSFWLTDGESITLPANSTTYLCARVDASMPNNKTGSFQCLTQAGMKTGDVNSGGTRDMLLYIITTDGNGVTKCEDKRTIISSSGYAAAISQLEKDVDTIENNLSSLKTEVTTITTATLSAGSTSLTISNSKITTSSALSFYTSIYGVSPLTATVSSGKVTLTFDAQSSAMTVGVKIDGSL